MGRRVFNTLLFNLIKKYMKIIDTHYCQTKTFYAGGNKLESGLSLFFVLDEVSYVFEDDIYEDSYGNFDAFSISSTLISSAKENREIWQDYLIKQNIETQIISTFLNLMEELFVIFVKSENGREYNTEAVYFVIHAGTRNHD